MDQVTILNHPRISKALFLSFCWTGLAIASCFVSFRLVIRWKLFRRLFWDDALVVFALICFIAQNVTWTAHPKGLFLAYDLTVGTAPWSPENIAVVLQSLKIQLAALMLFLSSLWAIKLAFLLFFRRIGTRTQGPKIWWWWFVAVTLLLTYIPVIGTLPYRCMTGTEDYIVAHCVGRKSGEYFYSIFYYHMSVDIFTDLLLMSVPITFLWNVQIPLKQKLGLMGLFSLTLMIIAVAIVRITVNGKQNGLQQDSAWIAFWAVIELTIAIIVACLGSFRQLFVKPGSSATTARDASNLSLLTSMKQRVSDKVPSRWQRGHHKSPSGRALMLHEDSTYSHDTEERMSEQKGFHLDYDYEISRAGIPLKRASQAHIAHHSAAPTERKYMVVHPGVTSTRIEKTWARSGNV